MESCLGVVDVSYGFFHWARSRVGSVDNVVGKSIVRARDVVVLEVVECGFSEYDCVRRGDFCQYEEHGGGLANDLVRDGVSSNVNALVDDVKHRRNAWL